LLGTICRAHFLLSHLACRIRLAIIQHIPLLAKQLGRDFFTDKLSSLCVGWLGDDISTIRNAAAQNLKELTALFGTSWACNHLLPSIEDIRHHSSYLRRLTAVQAYARMVVEMDPEVAQTEILPVVLEMANDTVPNIRFNVAKELADIAPVCGPNVYESQISPVLSMLMDDPDRDVRFYAERTSKILEDKFSSKGN
jgi:serine/threonine-protein phosphatase 2A regulatory subunit A